MSQADRHAEPVTMPASGPSVELVHELNNLLTIVLGSLEQLHRQALNARGKAQLERAQWAVEQAGKLVHHVIGPAT